MSSAFANIFSLFVVYTASIATSRSQQIKHISTLVPSCGPLNGATSVIINGTGFFHNDQVMFGGSVLSEPHVEHKSSEEIMLIISGAYARESKNFTVKVLSQNGKKKSNIKHFYVYDTPNYIKEIQPTTGWEGDTLTAKGRFLDCGAVKCRFGAVQMTVEAFYVSKVEIKCKVPRFDNHGVSSMSQNRASNGLTQTTLSSNSSDNSYPNGVQKMDPPPDPDNAKKCTISSDGQHFDSIPDNIVFTFRDPVKSVAVWIWVCRYIVFPIAMVVFSCLLSCCCSCEGKKDQSKFKSKSVGASGGSSSEPPETFSQSLPLNERTPLV